MNLPELHAWLIAHLRDEHGCEIADDDFASVADLKAAHDLLELLEAGGGEAEAT